MKKALCLVLVGVFAASFGLGIFATDAESAPECVGFYDAGTGLLTWCCWEWIPKSPNCKGKNCPGEFGWVCEDIPNGC